MAQRRRAPVQESLDIALPRPAETEVEAYGFIRKEAYIVFKVLYLFNRFKKLTPLVTTIWRCHIAGYASLCPSLSQREAQARRDVGNRSLQPWRRD